MADGIRPMEGLSDAMPQQWAGLRSEPPMSLPRPTGVMPVASAEASPPLDPPAVRSGFHGFRVSPRSELSVWTRRPKSGRLVRPIGMAPAARMRSTMGESVEATASASAGTPWVVAEPSTSMFSLIVKGTPWNTPEGSPAARRSSARRAAASADSASTTVTAFSAGFTASMRSRWAVTTSSDDTAPVAMRPARSQAPRRHSSSVISRSSSRRPGSRRPAILAWRRRSLLHHAVEVPMPDFYGDLYAPIEWKPDGDFRDITYETAEGIAKITINRPEVRNAFRPQTLFELADAFNRARDDADVGVIILTGAGDEAFCAGGDQRIRGDDGYIGDDAVAEKGIGRLNVLDLQIQIRRCPKPVVAMVAGWAMGGGHVLHVVCDLTIAADNAKFGQTGPKVGSFDGGYGSGLLARIVGQKKAREIWYLCDVYDAQAALDMGLVNTVVPLAELEQTTVAWCRKMLHHSPLALRMLKASLNAADDGLAGIQQLAGDATMLFYLTEEAQEGRDAYKDKRVPDFAKFPKRP